MRLGWVVAYSPLRDGGGNCKGGKSRSRARSVSEKVCARGYPGSPVRSIGWLHFNAVSVHHILRIGIKASKILEKISNCTSQPMLSVQLDGQLVVLLILGEVPL